jgi:hypothetical protein
LECTPNVNARQYLSRIGRSGFLPSVAALSPQSMIERLEFLDGLVPIPRSLSMY